MTLEYQVVDVFTTDPKLNGWQQDQGTSLDWDTVEKIGGNLGADVDCRYIKYLGKVLTEADNIIARFTFMADNAAVGTGKVIVGFFNVGESIGKDECFGMLIDTSTGSIRPHVYVAYSGGTKLTGTDVYNLVAGTKYIAAIRYVPEDGKAYLQIYDFITEQLLFKELVTIDTTKTFELNQVGISEYDTAGDTNAEAWIYDTNAVADPEPIVYDDLYATPEQIRKMTNLDAVQDMTDSMIAQIETVYAIPQVNSKFRAEGYAAPFDAGDDTPPLIRTITALLSAAYCARKSYVSHAPSESPVYESLLKEVNEIWEQLHNGELELIDIIGGIIERTETTSTDMLSTTEGQITLFTLNDEPDITTVMTGRSYFGRAGTSYRD